MMEQNRTRQRPPTGRTAGRTPPPKDAAFSAMLAQITVCLLLLAVAYALKLSGLPFYNTARAAVSSALAQEPDWSALESTLARAGLSLPSLPTAVPAGEKTPDPPTSLAASAEGEEPPVVDDELAGYLEQYGASQQEKDADDGWQEVYLEGLEEPAEDWQDAEVSPAETPVSSAAGQGGASTPMRVENGRLAAPDGMMLSPFFLTDYPILPIKSGTLTSRFGYRTHPITGKPDFHTGVDIAVPEGTPIGAVLGGTVAEVGQSDDYGNFIVLRHSSGLETAYCHCSEILAPVGAVIRQRETIAKAGSTGMSTGSHVHLEFRVEGMRANPGWVYDEF